MNAQSEIKLQFCTGFGQFDTHKADGQDYQGITGAEIVAMVQDPPKVDKDKGRWMIPSDYRAGDGREHEAQRSHGRFWWLALDVDENNLAMADIQAALISVACDVGRLIYSTRSSKAENRKWRALIPLHLPLSGADYADTATAFYDLLEEASDGTLIPDRALARPGQLVYLPNRGDFYDQEISKGAGRLVLSADHPIIQRRDDTRRQRAEAEAKAAEWKAWKARKAPTDTSSIVDAFNSAESVANLLAKYGYKQAGGDNDWRSPFQQSGSFATRDCGDHWISLSASDAAAGIGRDSKTGQRFGDAFDLFVHFEHGGGDVGFKAAIKAYALEIGHDYKTKKRETIRNAEPGDDVNALEPDETDLSHDALANDLGARSWDADAKHVALWNKWLFWSGNHWQKDERLSHLTQTRDFLRARANDLMIWATKKAATMSPEKADKFLSWAKDQAKTLRNKTTVAAVESLAKSNRASAASVDDFDSHRLLIGTPGGTVNLISGETGEAQRGHRITKLTATAPKRGTPVRWLQFLNEVFNGDQDMIEFVQRAAGYALTGETREHKLFFLYGTGRNGKSVFLNTLFKIWGDYARRAHAATFLNTNGEKHPTDLAGLQGARLVVASEIPKGKTWDESTIKDLTGGDTITARFMRGDFFDFEPQLSLFIAGNNMPSFRGVDEAIRARVMLIPFTVTFPAEKRDLHLEDKLWAEGPMILQWAIDGAIKWQRDGLKIPASVSGASNEYFDDEDTLGQFLADETIKDADAFTTTTDLHHRFKQWCEIQGLQPWTLRTLQKEVKGRGMIEARRNHGRGFLGLRL
jgi:P4 family phage/plasmid primase-like protien